MCWTPRECTSTRSTPRGATAGPTSGSSCRNPTEGRFAVSGGYACRETSCRCWKCRPAEGPQSRRDIGPTTIRRLLGMFQGGERDASARAARFSARSPPAPCELTTAAVLGTPSSDHEGREHQLEYACRLAVGASVRRQMGLDLIPTRLNLECTHSGVFWVPPLELSQCGNAEPAIHRVCRDSLSLLEIRWRRFGATTNHHGSANSSATTSSVVMTTWSAPGRLLRCRHASTVPCPAPMPARVGRWHVGAECPM